MDLKQRKLNKSEWTSIEVAVSKQEIDILNMIIKGYYDPNIRVNNNNSIFTFLKIEYSEKMEDYVYNKYLRESCDKIEKYFKTTNNDYKNMKINNDIKLNSADKVRLERFDENLLKRNEIYEYILLNHMEQIIHYKKLSNIKNFHFHYFTLYKLIKNNISKINRHIVELHLHTRKHLKNPVTLGLADGHRTGRVYLLNDVSVLGLSQVQVTV